MNLRDLEYLTAVADLKNFSQAAEKCHISQPTLSSQIKKVEELLGVRVFERTNKKVMLTDVGEQIIDSARRVLREVDTMKEIAQMAHDPSSGIFRLGAFPTLSTYIFPKLVPPIKESLPNLKLILSEEKTDQLLNKLLEGKLDATLLALPIENDHLVTQPLFADEFYLAVPSDHNLVERQEITPKDLAQFKLLLLEEGHCLRDQALDICHTMGSDEQQDFRATGLETLRQMVIAGTGITLMPEIAINKKEAGIHYIPFSDPKPKRTIGLVWRKTSTRSEVIDKIAALINQLT